MKNKKNIFQDLKKIVWTFIGLYLIGFGLMFGGWFDVDIDLIIVKALFVIMGLYLLIQYSSKSKKTRK